MCASKVLQSDNWLGMLIYVLKSEFSFNEKYCVNKAFSNCLWILNGECVNVAEKLRNSWQTSSNEIKEIL